jgi:excisionase family DNA binding protein
LVRAFSERRALLAQALSVAEVAELLGVGRQTPHDRAKAGTLLAVKENGRLVFPDWQFDPDGPDGVLPGLPEVLRAMRGPISALGRVRWFLTPKSLMRGRTPLEALRAGDVDEVIHEADSIGVS